MLDLCRNQFRLLGCVSRCCVLCVFDEICSRGILICDCLYLGVNEVGESGQIGNQSATFNELLHFGKILVTVPFLNVQRHICYVLHPGATQGDFRRVGIVIKRAVCVKRLSKFRRVPRRSKHPDLILVVIVCVLLPTSVPASKFCSHQFIHFLFPFVCVCGRLNIGHVISRVINFVSFIIR